MNPNRQNNCCPGRSGGGCGGNCVSSCGNNCGNNCGSGCGCGNGIIFGQQADGECACNRETVLQSMPIAMAYVPWQSFGNIYPVSQALRNGTMFRELDLDFAGRRCN